MRLHHGARSENHDQKPGRTSIHARRRTPSCRPCASATSILSRSLKSSGNTPSAPKPSSPPGPLLRGGSQRVFGRLRWYSAGRGRRAKVGRSVMAGAIRDQPRVMKMNDHIRRRELDVGPARVAKVGRSVAGRCHVVMPRSCRGNCRIRWPRDHSDHSRLKTLRTAPVLRREL